MQSKWKRKMPTRGASPVNPYEAVGRFVRAYYYYNLTSMFGDVPQSEALDAAVTQSPAYTPQEQVFLYVLNNWIQQIQILRL